MHVLLNRLKTRTKEEKVSELRNISSLAWQERSQRVQKNYKPRQESGWVYPL